MTSLFNLTTEQKSCTIGSATVGGQPGVNPPLLIPSLFQKGDPCVESRQERRFDRARAAAQIKRLEELSHLTGIPAIVAMVANSADEMKGYVDFFLDTTDLPFAIDMWKLEPRLEATKYVAALKLQDRFLYNSVTVWSPDVAAEVVQIREMGVEHIVAVVMDMANQLPDGRLTCLDDMLPKLEPAGFRSILVDTSAMNLPSTGICCLANRLIKEKYGLPAGAASANGTYMWQKATWSQDREAWGSREGFLGLDAGAQATAVALWSDFLFSGPMWGNDHVFPAVAAAHAMVSTMHYAEMGSLTENERTPLYRLFPEFAATLRGQAESVTSIVGKETSP
jgi:tetrahydromethanopterin S-methyltransferase subunit H